VEVVFKVNEGRPNVADHILNNQVQLIVNTPLGRESFFDDRIVRRVAMLHSNPCITTLTGASAAVEAIRALRGQELDVRALQDYYAETTAKAEVGKGRGQRDGKPHTLRLCISPPSHLRTWNQVFQGWRYPARCRLRLCAPGSRPASRFIRRCLSRFSLCSGLRRWRRFSRVARSWQPSR
jgi:hypothetical protein